MKKALDVILVLVLVLSFAAFGNESTEAADDSPVIGVALPQLDADGYRANLIGIQERQKNTVLKFSLLIRKTPLKSRPVKLKISSHQGLMQSFYPD